MTSSHPFEARIWIEDETLVTDIDIWVRELYPIEGNKRPITEWVKESASNYDSEFWLELIDEKDKEQHKNFQILVEGTIIGRAGHFDDDFEDEIEITKSSYIVLPDNWFGMPELDYEPKHDYDITSPNDLDK